MTKKSNKLKKGISIADLFANSQWCDVLSMTSDEVMDFMMKSAQYHEFELPEYYDFDKVLTYVRETVGNAKYEDCCRSGANKPSDKKVNFDVLMNKDGKYGVRPLVLTNPYLYYFLVREMCEKKHWKRLQEHFKECDLSEQGIYSLAMPIVQSKVEKFYKSTTILNWWRNMEQRSLELSLEYNYMFITDIANCYGSVNPQSIEWALNRRNTKKEISNNTTFATSIITYLKDMQQGRNVGIPQGGTIFNIVGELILSYCDLLLYERLQSEGIEAGRYVVLRYRDDYKIYSNDRSELKRISYLLQEVLEKLNFRMNTDKTGISDSIVTDTLKPDKLHCIATGPIINGKWCAFRGFQKHLMYILMFSRKYPNSGQLKVMLSDFVKRFKRETAPVKIKMEDGKDLEIAVAMQENVKAICAVATQIALENVTAVHYVLKVVSCMLDKVSEVEKEQLIDMIRCKLASQYNSTYTQLWLQNMSYAIDKRRDEGCPYDVPLCRVAYGEDVALWDNSWLKSAYVKDFPLSSVVRKELTDRLNTEKVEIVFKEMRDYMDDIDTLIEEAEKMNIDNLIKVLDGTSTLQQQRTQEEIVYDVPEEAFEYHKRMMQEESGVDLDETHEKRKQRMQEVLGVEVKDIKMVNGVETIEINGDIRDLVDEATYEEMMKERGDDSMIVGSINVDMEKGVESLEGNILDYVDEETYKEIMKDIERQKKRKE